MLAVTTTLARGSMAQGSTHQFFCSSIDLSDDLTQQLTLYLHLKDLDVRELRGAE
jgi:hypothetical protein